MSADLLPAPALDIEQARALTDQIRVGVEAVWELIKQAYLHRAWATLGYSSWDEYCDQEFKTSRLRLPREERADVVCSLRESGMSAKSIASAIGVNRQTVTNDLAKNSKSPTSPVVGADGRTYTRKPKPRPATEPDPDPHQMELVFQAEFVKFLNEGLKKPRLPHYEPSVRSHIIAILREALEELESMK